MPRTSVILIALLLSAMVICNPRIEKLRETVEKRFDEVSKIAALAPKLSEFRRRYDQIQKQYQLDLARSNESDANTHFQADTMHLLIDLFELENESETSTPIA
jgi:hypothetical protein